MVSISFEPEVKWAKKEGLKSDELSTVATIKIRRTQIYRSTDGDGTSESLRQLDDLVIGQFDETHSFASLLHNRFAFIGAIELKRASYRD